MLRTGARAALHVTSMMVFTVPPAARRLVAGKVLEAAYEGTPLLFILLLKSSHSLILNNFACRKRIYFGGPPLSKMWPAGAAG
jgi:hypothetical protein